MGRRKKQTNQTNTEPPGAPIVTPDGSEVGLLDDDALDETLGDLNVLEAFGADVTWYLYRITKKIPGASTGGSYVMRGSGPFDLEQVRAEVGGGEFLVLAKRGREMVDRRQFTIEGEPRMRPVPPLENPAPAPAAVSPEIAQLRDQVQQLRADLARTAAPATPPIGLRDLIALAKELHPPQPQTASVEGLVSMSRELFDLGREIAETNAQDQQSPVASVLRQVLPRVLDLVERMPFVARPANPPAAAITGSAPATAAAEPPQSNVLVEALLRAFSFGRTPAIAADSLEELMSPAEIEQVRSISADEFLGWIATFRGAYPPLAKDDAIAWLRQWHGEMQSSSESNGTPH